ncbi:hypothetical protein [Pseudomonas quasicaspiana]|uniref:hypothetical protein n=1 Tax=Pseudomonas quasicaspiana TaxID=2829821 RepID=UPI001E316FDD|nr:hypothetical protein [Pseudomonas quasicaspiana]MCD5978827.1 hypothetical protein [Pseudomonas quasicaspiana]
MINNHSLLFVSRVFLFFCCVSFFQLTFYFDQDYYIRVGGAYLNVPDHRFYTGVVKWSCLVPGFTSLNNHVVTYIYSVFFSLGVSDLVLASIFLNVVVIGLAYSRIELLCFNANGRFIPLLYWLGLFCVFQFSILINKDSFAVLFYVTLVSFLILRKKTDFFLLLLLSPIRMQFAMVMFFAFFLAFWLPAQKIKIHIFARVFFLYCLCSMVALYFELNATLLAHKFYAKGGVAYLISSLNSQYYAGSFLLNVIKPVQYVYDLFRSAAYDGSVLGLVVYFSRLYLVFIIGLMGVSFFRGIYLPWTYIKAKEKYSAAIVISSFFLVYSISPIVDFRYLINIAPALIVFFALDSRPRRRLCMSYSRDSKGD